MSALTAPCALCGRTVTRQIGGLWVDLEAEGDDIVWRENCDRSETFEAYHEVVAERDASLGVGHIWTAMRCPAYRTLDPSDCTCREA